MLRNMIVRTSSTGELMVIVICKITEDHEMELFKQLLQFVADSFPEITSLLYIINNKCNDTINDLDVHVFKGKDHIFEEMEGLRFKAVSYTHLNRKHFYDYVFMSPIYDSISKVNYYSTYTAEELREAQRAKIIDSKVMALGGINEDNLLEIKDFGFGGAVVLGDLWLSLIHISSISNHLT